LMLRQLQKYWKNYAAYRQAQLKHDKRWATLFAAAKYSRQLPIT